MYAFASERLSGKLLYLTSSALIFAGDGKHNGFQENREGTIARK